MSDLVTSTGTSATRSGLRSASLSYREPAVRTKFGERAFSNSEPAARNSLYLIVCMQSTANTNAFKRQFKTHLFTEALQ